MKKTLCLLLCALLALMPAVSLANKNKDNLPIGDLAGFEGGWNWFGEDFHYDITNEEACWELLQKPITVLDVEEKEMVYPLDAPGGEPVVNQWQGGFINGSTAGVHVLGEDEDGWTLIEGMDYYDRVIRGYVKTRLLKTVKPNNEYGIIIDKLTQKLHLFVDGRLWSTVSVSTGLANKSQPYNETATGEYLIGSWVGGFDSEGMYCEMGIRFNGGDLLHKVPYTTYRDGTKDFAKYGKLLGRKASHGCVRVMNTANEEGLNISWLWNNIKRNTKVIVWDDDGRVTPYPDDDLQLFYNPNGGASYHEYATCRSVRDKYLPLTAFSYGELDSGDYARLDPCPYCIPAQRKKVIDEINQERIDVGMLLKNPAYTGDTSVYTPPQSEEEEEVVVTITIR